MPHAGPVRADPRSSLQWVRRMRGSSCISHPNIRTPPGLSSFGVGRDAAGLAVFPGPAQLVSRRQARATFPTTIPRSSGHVQTSHRPDAPRARAAGATSACTGGGHPAAESDRDGPRQLCAEPERAHRCAGRTTRAGNRRVPARWHPRGQRDRAADGRGQRPSAHRTAHRSVRARRGGLPADRHAAARRDRGGRRPRPVLGRADAAATAAARAPRYARHPRRAHRRRTALRLARRHAGCGTAFHSGGAAQAADRPALALQAQRAALAPHRRPGLAHRDTQVPEAHQRRRLAQRGRRQPQRRLLHAAGHPRHRRIRAPAQRHDRAGDRDAGPRVGGGRGLPVAVLPEAADPGAGDLGRVHRHLLRGRRGDVCVPARRARRGGRAVPRAVHPHRRRRGAQAAMGSERLVAAAHA